MHIEAPSEKIGATIALVLPEAAVVTYRVVTVAPRRQNKSVKIPESHRKHFLVIEVKKLMHLLRGILFVADPECAIYI
jgi:hypothetical protein